MNQSLIQGILKNDHGSIARVMSLVENNEISGDILSKLHIHSKKSIRVGITGPPGAGKSTITNALIEICLANQKTVGVIAVDPTSPFTGGALLGDRVRMNKYSWDEKVFIRSLGSHGDLGGLSRKAHEIGDVLAASGKDYIFFETVGVGQGEHDIINTADICVVVLTPESGDEIQLMKAGLIEIADIFIVNKSDRQGANRISSLLKNVLHSFSSNKVIPAVFNTIASQNVGIVELFTGIQSYLKLMEKSGDLNKKRLNRYKKRVRDLVRESLERSFWNSDKIQILDQLTKKLDQIKEAPHIVVKQLLKKT
tara:strand:+ start:36 stop:965 length:930 start_codon:yes stop_codon:yes gene_type:complete